jgi:hypothetical protein
MNWYIFGMAVSAAFALLGQLSDCYTTEVGLAGGMKEANSIAIWLTNKIGNTGLTLLKCIGLAQGLPILAYEASGQDPVVFIVAAGVAGAIGWVAGIENYLLNKKYGIKLF